MKVYSYLITLSRDRAVAEEITQKAFFKALTTEQKYRGEASVFTWLCSIAKNLYRDELRRQNRHAQILEEPVSEEDPLNALSLEDTAFAVHQILHELKEPYKEVFSLRVFGELSFQKIGLLFGKTENWARVTYHRARIQIQERMKEK